jgi:hypothetical protein
MFFSVPSHDRQEHDPQHYGLPAAPLPSTAVAERSQSAEFNHNAGVPWRSHFVEGSKGW